MKKYQIFISSTYDDLQEERQAVLESVLKLRHIPVGMEQFVATNEKQFHYIKKLLDDTDYYIVIVGNRYGSIADDGFSYTEKEFDYAVSLNIPVIACVHKNPSSLPVNKSETDYEAMRKLERFREKIMHNRIVSYINWTSPESLTSEIVVALSNVISDNPRKGWERVENYENAELLAQLNDLRLANEELSARLKAIEESADIERLIKDFSWEETRSISAQSKIENYKGITIETVLSWKQCFSIIGRILLIESNITLVHYAFSHALFLDREPYFSVSDVDFQVIMSEFGRLKLVDFNDNRVNLTHEGKNFLYSTIPVENEVLETIHQKVLSIVAERQQHRSGEDIAKFLKRLSNFNSNPESINYLGQTLLDLKIYLNKRTDWKHTEIDEMQKVIQDILTSAFDNDRLDMGSLDPVFDLSKVSIIIDFLQRKQ